LVGKFKYRAALASLQPRRTAKSSLLCTAPSRFCLIPQNDISHTEYWEDRCVEKQCLKQIANRHLNTPRRILLDLTLQFTLSELRKQKEGSLTARSLVVLTTNQTFIAHYQTTK
jgi:hypothetical protein